MAASRAWTFSQRGSPSDILSLTSSRPIPTLPPPEISRSEEWILVKVAFAALNVGAIFQMALVPAFMRNKTCIPEMDLSGTVQDVWHPHVESTASSTTTTAAAAADATTQTRFRKGDKIIAMIPASHALPTGSGALAEYVALPARFAVHKPPQVSFADAAGCLLTGMTAHQQVVEAGIKPGDRVLVNAASGGIGTMVVQMARQVVGPEGFVVGICSTRNVQLVESLGADLVIDYTQHTDSNNNNNNLLPAHLAKSFHANPFNAIIDTLGHQSLYVNSPAYLVPSGTYSSVGIKPPDFSVPNFLRAVWQMKLNEWWPVSRWLGGVGRLWRGVSMMEPTLEDRERIAEMLGGGKIRVVRDSVWPFDGVKEAYAKLGGLHASGKILVRVDETVGDDEC
ncbi:hypothetical protein ACSS6W_009065 [Trichoderma asperelloides]